MPKYDIIMYQNWLLVIPFFFLMYSCLIIKLGDECVLFYNDNRFMGWKWIGLNKNACFILFHFMRQKIALYVIDMSHTLD